MSFITRIKEKKKEEKVLKSDYNIFIERPQISFFLKLFHIIIKNIQLLIRSKFSALIFILGPILVVLLVALSFNTTTLYDLNIAAYSEDYSEISNSIITDLEENQYNVIKLESKEECIDSIKFQDFQVCLIFGPNIVLENDANNVIDIYVDNSRLNFAHLISGQITNRVDLEASEISSGAINQVLSVLDSSNVQAEETKSLTTNLISTNSNLKNSIEDVSQKLDTTQGSFDILSTEPLTLEIGVIENKTNLSVSTFDTLNSLIETLSSNIATTQSTVGGVQETIPQISNQINTDSNTISDIDSRLGTISTNINAIAVTNADTITTPIKTSIQPISSNTNYLLYLLPTILVILVMLVALFMSSTTIVQEKTSQAFFRNFITPTNENLFMLGELLSNFLILGIQISLMVTILGIFISEISFPSLVLVWTSLLIIGLFFIVFGMLLGYLFNTKETVTLAALTSGIVFLLFSNTLIPLETLSAISRKIVFYNPYLLGENMLKKIFLFEATFPDIANLAYLLLGFTFAVLVGAILARRLSKHFLNIR
jgi:ABC-type multidrug transport system permease subunit